MKNQKFFRGQRVRVADDLGSMMRHFTSGCDAIVVGSFSDQMSRISGADMDIVKEIEESYTLLLLKSEDGTMSTASWYEESQLTLVSDDRIRGEEILQKHKHGDNSWLSEAK